MVLLLLGVAVAAAAAAVAVEASREYLANAPAPSDVPGAVAVVKLWNLVGIFGSKSATSEPGVYEAFL